jgi:hypothetical protein
VKSIKLSYKYEGNSVFGDIYRPLVPVNIWSEKFMVWILVWMIVDTGADYTLFPLDFSKKLGINLKNDCTISQASGIGGNARVYLPKRPIAMKLWEWERNIPIGILAKSNFPPLLGRIKGIETFRMTFNKKQLEIDNPS